MLGWGWLDLLGYTKGCIWTQQYLQKGKWSFVQCGVMVSRLDTTMRERGLITKLTTTTQTTTTTTTTKAVIITITTLE